MKLKLVNHLKHSSIDSNKLWDKCLLKFQEYHTFFNSSQQLSTVEEPLVVIGITTINGNCCAHFSSFGIHDINEGIIFIIF